MRDSVLMKRERSRENDEEHDQIRKERTDVDVDLAGNDFDRRGAEAAIKHAPTFAFFFFNLLRCLPEKQVGADRRPQNRDQHSPLVVTLRPGRNEGGVRNHSPIRMNDEP